VDSDQRRSPTRVAFVTRRTSAQVKSSHEDQVQTFPEVLFRAVLAIELLAIVLVVFSLLFNAPLEGIADPTHTPNPAKAPLVISLGCRSCCTTSRQSWRECWCLPCFIVSSGRHPLFQIFKHRSQWSVLMQREKRLRIFYP